MPNYLGQFTNLVSFFGLVWLFLLGFDLFAIAVGNFFGVFSLIKIFEIYGLDKVFLILLR